MSDYPCYKCEKMIKSHEPRFFHLIKEENTMSWTCEECHKQLMNEYQEKNENEYCVMCEHEKNEKTKEIITELEEIIAQGCGLANKESMFTSLPKEKKDNKNKKKFI